MTKSLHDPGRSMRSPRKSPEQRWPKPSNDKPKRTDYKFTTHNLQVSDFQQTFIRAASINVRSARDFPFHTQFLFENQSVDEHLCNTAKHRRGVWEARCRGSHSRWHAS